MGQLSDGYDHKLRKMKSVIRSKDLPTYKPLEALESTETILYPAELGLRK